MKIDNVFLAFLKSDCKEHLLFKKEDNLYYDLNSKEKYTTNDIDLNTLIYFKDSIYTLYDNMLKLNIKKLYNKDRKKLFDVADLVMVDINRVTNYEVINLDNGYKQYRWQPIFLYKSILKRYTPHSYSDLRNNKMYIGEVANMFMNGCLYVNDSKDSNIKYLRYEYPNLGSIEKKKVLELAYKLSKNK